MENYDKVFLGTEVKLNLTIDPIGENHMSEYDWEVTAWTNSRKHQNITSKDAYFYPGKPDSAIIEIDTAKLGIGQIKLKVTAKIPDVQSSGGCRTEVVILNTNIIIVDA